MTVTESQVGAGKAFSAEVNRAMSGGTSNTWAPLLIMLSGGTGVTVRLTRIKLVCSQAYRILIVHSPLLSGGTAMASPVNRFIGKGQTAKSSVLIEATDKAAVFSGGSGVVVDDFYIAASTTTALDRSQDPYVLVAKKIGIFISGGSGANRATASGVIEWDET
jgi:hypothetical protein